MPPKGYKAPPRIFAEKWLEENSEWKPPNNFAKNGQRGKEARTAMKQYVWDNIPLKSKSPFFVGDEPPVNPPNNKKFNNAFDMWVVTARGEITQERKDTRKMGEQNKQTDLVHMQKRMANWRATDKGKEYHATYNKSDSAKESQKKYRKTEKGKSVIPRYRQTENGRLMAVKHSAIYREKKREEHFEQRANQEYKQLNGTVMEVAMKLLSKEYNELQGMKPVEYAKKEGPIQFFVTKQEGDTFVYQEAMAILAETARPYPAIMKNPAGYPLGRRVDPDEVEVLQLERFTTPELKEMGWDYIPLIDLDLTQEETGRVAYTIEQQLQLLVHDELSLGHERLNRVPGAGNWDNPGGHYIVGMAFPPLGFKEMLNDYSVLTVNGKTSPFQTPKNFADSIDGIKAAFV